MDINQANGEKQIDVVITWVDGRDPEHRKKRMEYQTGCKDVQRNDVGGDTRFHSVGEINYCIASINKFAPFIRKIYIVTDNQNPHVEEFLDKRMPGKHIPMEIVDHKTIFRGYEQYLPTFNSMSIECMLWRIPGLSEYYIYLNDDFSLIRPVTVRNFIRDGKLRINGYRRNTAWLTWLEKRHDKKVGDVNITLRKTLLNASYILKSKRCVRLVHAPQVLRKSIFEKFFKEHEEVLIHNIKHRFRDISQYNASELLYLLALEQGEASYARTMGNHLYLYPAKYSPSHLKNKLKRFSRNRMAYYLCINSLDMTAPELQKEVVAWLENRLGI